MEKYLKGPILRLVKHYECGDMYEGAGLFDNDKKCCMAHGDGKWTFADGEILEGEMVAYRDEPRFKRRKIEK